MEQLQSSEVIVGQTIVKVMELDSLLAIIFEDSYILYKVNRGYESGDEAFEVYTDKPKDYVLMQMGLMTEEEYNKRSQEYTEKFKKQQEASELATYRRLHKKYGG